MKYKIYPKYVITLLLSHVFFEKNQFKFGIIEKNIDDYKYIISFDEYCICECLVFKNDELYDFYVLDYSTQKYNGKLLKEYVKI